MFDRVKEAAKTLANQVAYGAPPAGPAVDALSELTLTRLDGAALPAADLAGKVVLVVNVASRCGLTPQYAQLVDLHHRYGPRGLVVLGAPCNQFLGQEPGSAGEIAEFCSVTYGVDFPLLEKQDVNGAHRSPLFHWLISSAAGKGADISWNFEKFLVGRDGEVKARFSPRTPPDAPEVLAAIEAALG